MTLARTTGLVVLALVTALGGCAPSWKLLRSENDDPALSALKDTAAARPLETHWVATRVGDGPTLQVAVHEAGPADADRTLVMIHGCLSDHRCFRFLRGALCDHRVVLVDLPGSGDSDRPHPRLLGPDGYAPDSLAEHVAQALESRPTVRTGGSITMIGHSLGCAVILRLLGSEAIRSRHATLVAAVDRAVLLSAADLEIVQPPHSLRMIAETDPAAFDVGLFTGHVSAAVYEHARSCDVLREEADRTLEILQCPRRRRALQAMLRQFTPRCDDRPDWPAIEAMVADYANVDVPCLVIWGACDDVLPVATGYKLAAQLPRADLVVLPECGHAVPVQRPRRCAALIREFVRADQATETTTVAHSSP